ncbi:pyruvate dehydrogenase (acetyl-transferring) E1 component subunit alpha [Aeromicrobium sp. 636]|uniref:Pyruvate dehydrogenase (Acetyl-transferring) E1 component subunit alpha n=1 Tax=Aeromicrobium senzhongii TaxID=2663859 RepID=A0A8I0K1I9_9ACTN|nr:MULTISPECIES: pyruvate dehydrogenase (acetyl-transferring) E1 component subunit alpha [Aeromicrobium]MBC9227586.1 pyruvate dehydrogenase (acetyl-transferring) E1 component subunit alpha [Aeromicrobium senzhongii]MCQ3999683.1 pyruvate dehydrogenase (acetyl-transferring) E1 component subunit alpha [Aeromicrobium sp. 636]
MGLPISQTLAPDGQLVAAHDFTTDDLRAFHRDLVLARRIDTEAFALQRHGELGLWPPMLGQEAAQIGSGRALAPDDFVFPSYREHAVAWCRGLDPALLLAIFRGTSLGGWDPADHNIALPAIIIGAQTLHAVGYGIGLTLEGKEDAVVAYFGDGATSQGDTNEAFAWAASYNAPVVFFCQNNHYAISVPLERQTRVPIAQRADGFGFEGVRVDGNDVLAVHQVTTEALAKARAGGGPTLVEAITYRMGAHTTSDDPSRYRDPHEADEWAERDPLQRLRSLLERTDPDFVAFDAAVQTEAEELGEHLREVCGRLPDPDLAELFEHVYDQIPPELVAQREEVRSWS